MLKETCSNTNYFKTINQEGISYEIQIARDLDKLLNKLSTDDTEIYPSLESLCMESLKNDGVQLFLLGDNDILLVMYLQISLKQGMYILRVHALNLPDAL